MAPGEGSDLGIPASTLGQNGATSAYGLYKFLMVILGSH